MSISHGCARAALLSLSLAVFAAPGQAQYTLMRGSLHAHTQYSDSSALLYTDRPASAAFLAFQNTLDVFATTDHGEHISDSEWTNTVADMTGATVPGKSVALWGFEWTASKDSAPLSASGLGHINVYGSANRAGMANNSGASSSVPSDWVNRLWWRNDDGVVNHADTLYQWILDKGVSPRGGTIVGQFNHPSGMPGVSLGNPSSRVIEGDTVVVTDWWRKLEWVAPLDPYMTLMEMGGRGVNATLQPMQHQAPWSEPYFQLALDNGWHLAPTNGEDNHRGAYGQDTAPAPPPDRHALLVSTGIWMEPTAGLTKEQAQARLLAALRERRTFSAEYRAGLHKDGPSLKFTVNTVADGVKWMGDRTLKPHDLGGDRCRLEIKPGKGLTLDSVEVVTNRGVVARALPLSGPGVTVDKGVYSWAFGLEAARPAAQIRAFSDAPFATNAYANPPLPPTWNGGGRGVVLSAAGSGHLERYFYVRATQRDANNKPYYLVGAPVWVQRTARVPVSYRWEFGDGTPDQTVTVPASPAPDTVYSEVRHTFPAGADIFHPRVTVTYSDGGREAAVARVAFGAAPATPFMGDLNGDGQINDEDLGLLFSAGAGLAAVTGPEAAQRGKVTSPAQTGAHLGIADTVRLQRLLSGAMHANRAIPAWP